MFLDVPSRSSSETFHPSPVLCTFVGMLGGSFSNDDIGTRTAVAGTKTSQAEQGKVSNSISSFRGLDRGWKRGDCSTSHQSFSTHDITCRLRAFIGGRNKGNCRCLAPADTPSTRSILPRFGCEMCDKLTRWYSGVFGGQDWCRNCH